ncbi:MAG: electron transport complex subunit E [Ruminococcus sp.]|nr:electron transport complex subunit E [Ruminococcus sp.]
MNNRKQSFFSGLFSDNTVLSAFMVMSPVIVCADTLKNAFAMIYAFSAVTFLSVLISSFVPKKIPYALKIIIYTIISSIVYIPVKMTAKVFYPESITAIGIYYPLISVNSLIVLQTEVKFFRTKKSEMMLLLISYILGFDIVMLITAFIRELLAYGTLNSRMMDIPLAISGAGQTFGGFICLGLLCGLYRKIKSYAESEKNVSDK